MNTSPYAVSWASEGAALVAEWDNRPETTGQLAERLRDMLQAVEAVFGNEVVWDQGPPSRAPLDMTSTEAVERFVAASVARDDFGDAHPASGFEFSVWGSLDGRILGFQFFVGSSVSGRRKPSNRVLVRLVPATTGQVDAVLVAIAEYWQPASAVAWNTAASMLSGGRGCFAPPIGQRTWLRNDLGAITSAPRGVRVEQVAGGTLLCAVTAGSHSRSSKR